MVGGKRSLENMELNKLFSETYKNKKVFVTGHTGFKGTWLSIWLQSLGAQVKGYSLNPESDESLFESVKSKLECESVISDIRDKEKLQSEILNFKPDFIFHLAAKALVRYSYSFPLETFETNISGTANLLNSLIKLENECKVIIVTTDKVYENKEWIYPYRENDELGGYDPYSASKACAEIVTSSFRNSFFNLNKFETHRKSISTARAGNVIGGGDYSEDRIIPDLIKSFKTNSKVKIRNPESVRPWQHVLDPLSGYLLLGCRMNTDPKSFSDAYNFGPSIESNLTVLQLVEIALSLWRSGSFEISENKNEPHEASQLRLDISKSMIRLGWNPKWDSHKAVEKTILWYKNNLDKSIPDFEMCLNDIDNYQKS